MTKPVPPSQFQSRGPTKPESPPVLFQTSPQPQSGVPERSSPERSRSVTGAQPQPPQESSSLFSLSSLQDLATSVSIAPNSPQQLPEGSGMLDVRALADAARKKESDPFMIAAPGHGPAATLISTPERLVDREESSRKRMMAALVVMAVALLALGGTTAFLALRTRPTALGQEAVASTPANAANVPPPVPAAPSTTLAPAAIPAAPVQAVPAAPAAAAAPVARVPAPAPVAAVKPSTKSQPAAGSEEAPREHHRRARDSESAGSSDDLNPTPTREEVLSAMQKVTSRVTACARGASGMALAKVTVSGATGRVMSVEVDGADLGAAKACIVHEVSRAKFPAFSNPSFSVTYPFRL
jgi:hypothetical protein